MPLPLWTLSADIAIGHCTLILFIIIISSFLFLMYLFSLFSIFFVSSLSILHMETSFCCQCMSRCAGNMISLAVCFHNVMFHSALWEHDETILQYRACLRDEQQAAKRINIFQSYFIWGIENLEKKKLAAHCSLKFLL